MKRYYVRGDAYKIELYDSVAQGRVMEAVEKPTDCQITRLMERAEALNKKEKSRYERSKHKTVSV